MKQRDVFLASEADAWYQRNHRSTGIERTHPTSWVHRVPEIVDSLDEPITPKLLEIGAADGSQMRTVAAMCNVDCYGLEPSRLAVEAAKSKGSNVVEGTADSLPFDSNTFDIVVFGFCLYICDLNDYKTITTEADRTLRASGYLIIHDFYSPTPRTVPYAHADGVVTTKMDFRELFSLRGYMCVEHSVRSHETGLYTDDRDEWVMTSVLKKAHPPA